MCWPISPCHSHSTSNVGVLPWPFRYYDIPASSRTMLRLIPPLQRVLGGDHFSLLLRVIVPVFLASAPGHVFLISVYKFIQQTLGGVDYSLILVIPVGYVGGRVRRSKKLDLAFYVWLLSMALASISIVIGRHAAQVSAWRRWYWIFIAFGQVAAVLKLALPIENVECSTCSRKRFSLDDISPEGRARRDIFFVSKPAFGPPWLMRGLKRFLDRATVRFAKLHIRSYNYFHPKKQLSEVLLERGQAMHYVRQNMTHVPSFVYTAFRLSWLLLRTIQGGDPPFSLSATIYTNYLFAAVQIGAKDIVWSAWDLIAHHTLQVDGVMYELKRVGWFRDSIELTRQSTGHIPGVLAFGENVLSWTAAGQTYFTDEEILQCAEELIKISPNYDVIMYNCQAMRFNLFRRILDDRDGSAFPADSRYYHRLDWFYMHPNNCILQLIFFVATFFRGEDPFSDYTTLYGLSRCILAIIQFDHIIKGITYGTSTAYGRVFCFRRACILVSCMLLVISACWPSPNAGNLILGPHPTPLGRLLFILGLVYVFLVAVAMPFQAIQGYGKRGREEVAGFLGSCFLSLLGNWVVPFFPSKMVAFLLALLLYSSETIRDIVQGELDKYR
ncbi:hypothetical protein BJX99DRAFT_87648 [Aspergillus californicus]